MGRLCCSSFPGVLTDLYRPGVSLPGPERRVRRVGAQRVGISTDTVDRQAHFARQRSFDYPLLSDADGRGVRAVRGAPGQTREAGYFGRGASDGPASPAHAAPWPAGPAAAGQADHIRHRHRPLHTEGRLQRGARIGARRRGVAVLEQSRPAVRTGGRPHATLLSTCRSRRRSKRSTP